MPEPVVLARAEHPISRRDIDPDALKVLYRLHQFKHVAYLVGGSVRDLMLQRRPKDFDVGTDAHPYEIKKLFRNCWIIGRRFRLAHVRFGPKTIEVATFRRHVLPGTENEPATTPAPAPPPRRRGGRPGPEPPEDADAPEADRLDRHDNTFGTAEEDAFRRDFTINALFYDIATFTVIDYVGGLKDLREGVIRSIGDPRQRFQEDPVRMLRAVALAARLGFSLEPPVADAIAEHGPLLATASPARLIEEYYKVLRSGAAEKTFRLLAEHKLLETITPELHHGSTEQRFWLALADLDRYRLRFESAPDQLSNPVLLGTLLVPLELMPKRTFPAVETFVERPGGRRFRRFPKEPALRLGMLAVARRDTERLRQILSLQRWLADLDSSPRLKRSLMNRAAFFEALTWFEIHGHLPDVLEHWRGFIEAVNALPAEDGEGAAAEDRRRFRRRRRRGGRRR